MQSREDSCNRANGATQEPEASAEVHRLPCLTQPIFQPAGRKAIPLYQLMKKTEKFTWTPQANEAFRELKRMLSTTPILAASIEKKPMMLYIAATNRVISVVMVVERPEKDKAEPIQRPVYYISEVLSASKQNYPHYQKMCYGVYMAAKKLRPYFQAHPITVVSSAPLADIMGIRDATGRVAKWGIEIA